MHSSVYKLQKFIKLEIERGYDNRAVVGGLDKILPAWELEARANQLDEALIQLVLDSLRSYPEGEPAARAELLTHLLNEFSLPASAPHSEPISPSAQSTEQSFGQVAEQAEEPKEEPHYGRAGVYSAPAQRDTVYDAPHEELQGLKASLKVLNGVGPQYLKVLNGVGLNTIEDLLYYFPRRYDDYSQLKPINRLTFGEETTLLGTIQSIVTRPIRSGKLQLTEAVIGDGTGFLRVSWFNQPWLMNKLTPNTQVVLAGKVDQYLGRLTMNSPEVELVEQEHLHTNRIVPVYPLTAQLTQKMIRKMVYQAIHYWASKMPDPLPESVRVAVKLAPLSVAMQNVHFPESQDMLDVARWRLAFDEIFFLQLGVMKLKRNWKTASGQVFDTPQSWVEEQIQRLPFSLTGAQKRVIGEIQADLASGRPMERLIQGDVGSGKTVVAALAAGMIALGGGQSAIMAPTSILAEQHYRSLTRLLTEPGELIAAPFRAEEIRLLIGDTPEAERAQIRAGAADGSVKLVIGTHALFEDPIVFQRLQLVVIDEQHRFGVAQRAALRSKGENPHLLVMTATPIPRSLALTVYGDLDLSVMDEMPAGRQPVSTFVLAPLERERAYHLIEAQVKEGHQAFIIYPLVEQGEKEDPLAAVEEHKRLQNETFRKLSVGLLHGRMKPDEKDEVMRRFRDGEYQILVSTTVVEVGVDIPNASVMLIEGANRFGLAQLHQLRGRVGRGSAQSVCLLIPDHEDALENERLTVMAETNDGFVLAERDLQQRGPGEFLGTRQAGYSELKMANLTDVRLIEKAREQAQILFQNDPDLLAPEHQPLVEKLKSFWEEGKGDIS